MENNAYINILIDTLTKKITELDKLLQLTLIQEKYLSENSFSMEDSMEDFSKAVLSKKDSIEKLNQLDNGFEQVYERVREDLAVNGSDYKDKVMVLQLLIKQIMEKNAKLQSLEMNNKMKFDIYFKNKRREIKDFKVSRRTAAAYYKNMPDQHYGQSCFFNQKK